MELPAPVEPLDDYNPRRDPGSETVSLDAPKLLTHRNSDIINVCCFKLLSFEVTCYVAIDNLYRPLSLSFKVSFERIHDAFPFFPGL